MVPSLPAHQSLGSEGSDPHSPQPAVDDRKRKRMLSNRESARRSRLRKQQRLDELVKQVAQLSDENCRIAMQADLLAQEYQRLGSENAGLRAQVMELTERLQSLSSVLRFVEEFSGTAMDIPEIPDPLLEPWQLPCPAQRITAAADMFLC